MRAPANRRRPIAASPARQHDAPAPRRPRARASAAALLLALAFSLDACTATTAPPATAAWYDVVSQPPGPEVTDAGMRRKIEATSHPWKVRDRATGIEMVLVMPGEFVMGSPESEPGRGADEGPQHRVRLTRAFYLGATEVTQAQWRRLMGPTPSFFDGESRPIDPSWNDVQAYLARANAGGLPEREPLRLPTEAEWEYACRAGTTGRFGFPGPIRHDLVNFNDGDVRRAVVVNGKLEVEWQQPPAPDCRMSTAPAGSLPPNAWGCARCTATSGSGARTGTRPMPTRVAVRWRWIRSCGRPVTGCAFCEADPGTTTRASAAPRCATRAAQRSAATASACAWRGRSDPV